MARFVHGRGVRNIAVLAVNDTGTKSLADSFADEFRRLGGTIAPYVLAPKDGNDLRTQIATIRSSAPDAIFAVGYGRQRMCQRA